MSDTPWMTEGVLDLGEAAAPSPEKQPRQRRKPRAAIPAAPAKVKRPRKAAEPKAPGVAQRHTAAKKRKEKQRNDPQLSIKIGLHEYALLRVGEGNVDLFLKGHGLLAPAGKAARVKVLAELTKLLG